MWNWIETGWRTLGDTWFALERQRTTLRSRIEARDGHSRHDDELLAVTNELAKVDASVDRYLRAFESGSMPEALCGERVKELATRATVLRTRHEDLNAEMEQADITCASPEELATLRDRVNEAIAEGSPAVVKSLLQALIHEIRVDKPQRHPARLSCAFGWRRHGGQCGSRTVPVGGR